MPAAGLEATRRLLEESAAQISRSPPGRPDAEAFAKFKTGVGRASSSCDAPPEQLLADLEPKAQVLRYLIELHEQKSIYRKQVATVMAILLQVNTWLAALLSDGELCARLPEDLRAFLDSTPSEEEATPPAVEEGEATPTGAGAPGSLPSASDDVSADVRGAWSPARGQGVGDGELGISRVASLSASKLQVSEEEVRAAIAAALARVTPVKRCSTNPDTITILAELERGMEQIAALGFSAEDRDEAASAFENFRRAVSRVVGSPAKEDDEALEGVEPKKSILDFLLDLQRKRRKYSSRVSVTLSQLLAFDAWRAAAEADPSLHAELRDFILDECSRAPSTQSAPSPSTDAEVASALSRASAQGAAGILWVRVLAARDLRSATSTGCTDPFARVVLSGRTQRTEAVRASTSPRWDAVPFIFGVPTWDAKVKFEVLSYDWTRSELLGSVEMRAADAPPALGEATQRLALGDGAQGELEVQMAFLACEVPTPPSARGGARVPELAAGAIAETVVAPATPQGCGELPFVNPEDDEYFIHLPVVKGKKVGLSENGDVLVIGVIKDSLVADWNAAHPDRQVRPGDVVIELNGERGDSQKMVAELKKQCDKLDMWLRRAEATVKGRWMYADTWNHAIAKFDPLRWSEELPKDKLLRELRGRPHKHRQRPVVVQVRGRCHHCSTEEEVDAVLSVRRDSMPVRYHNAPGWPAGGQSEVLVEGANEEDAMRAAERAVRADPSNTICEVTWKFMRGWTAKSYVGATEFVRGRGKRHLVYADALANRDAFREE